MYKRYFKFLMIFLLFSCTQKEPAEIVYKGDKIYRPVYSDVLIESTDAKISRYVTTTTDDEDEYDREDIIDEEEVMEEEKKNKNKKNTEITKNEDGTVNSNSKSIKKYYKNSSSYEEDEVGYYTVVDGDNLWSIAHKYGMKTTELAKLNDIKKPYTILVGQRLKVNEDSKNKKKSTNIKTYTVKSGDTLSSIATQFDTTTDTLAEYNNLKYPYTLYVGEKLNISSPSTEDSKNKKKSTNIKTYTVKSGDTLSSIATQFDTTTDTLAEYNNLKYPYTLYVGEKLNISSPSTEDSKNKKKSTNIKTYTVKSGDTLSSIATQFDTTTDTLAEYNNLKYPYTLYVGEKLKIVSSSNTTNKSKSNTIIIDTKNQQSSKSVQSSKKNTNKENSFMWPVKGKLISTFGPKENGLINDGINISAESGTNFVVTESGIVAYVGNGIKGYGYLILIKHSGNWISAYAHCESVSVKKGDEVSRGQIIGTVGATGNVSSPQLYFSLRKGREAVDPEKYLK